MVCLFVAADLLGFRATMRPRCNAPGGRMGVVRGVPSAARVGGPSPRHGRKLRTARLPVAVSGCWIVGRGERTSLRLARQAGIVTVPSFIATLVQRPAMIWSRRSGQAYNGRIEAGFDFLGCRFGQAQLELARQTVRKHVERLLRLYEQQAKKKATPCEVALALGAYVKRWRLWCRAGLGSSLSGSWSYEGTVPVLLSQGP
jgi:hypothetical protein